MKRKILLNVEIEGLDNESIIYLISCIGNNNINLNHIQTKDFEISSSGDVRFGIIELTPEVIENE